MFGMIWPVVLAVFGCILYNVCAKETPSDIQPFASLTITYLMGTILALIAFFLLSDQKTIFVEFQKANFTSWALGLTILCQEVAYIFLYRVGWKVSTGSLIANITSSILLLVVGIFLYREALTIKQVMGIVICIAGLLLINLPNKAVVTKTAQVEGGIT
jgi:drug/metabolite transporter (DMT)-like permease